MGLAIALAIALESSYGTHETLAANGANEEEDHELRRFSVLLVVVTACLGMVLAAALVVTTTRLHVAAQRIGVSIESLAISEDIALELVSLRRRGSRAIAGRSIDRRSDQVRPVWP